MKISVLQIDTGRPVVELSDSYTDLVVSILTLGMTRNLFREERAVTGLKDPDFFRTRKMRL